MIRSLLERYYVSQYYWDYRSCSLNFQKETDDLLVEKALNNLDFLWYEKLTWLEKRLLDTWIKETYALLS